MNLESDVRHRTQIEQTKILHSKVAERRLISRDTSEILIITPLVRSIRKAILDLDGSRQYSTAVGFN